MLKWIVGTVAGIWALVLILLANMYDVIPGKKVEGSRVEELVSVSSEVSELEVDDIEEEEKPSNITVDIEGILEEIKREVPFGVEIPSVFRETGKISASIIDRGYLKIVSDDVILKSAKLNTAYEAEVGGGEFKGTRYKIKETLVYDTLGVEVTVWESETGSLYVHKDEETISSIEFRERRKEEDVLGYFQLLGEQGRRVDTLKEIEKRRRYIKGQEEEGSSSESARFIGYRKLRSPALGAIVEIPDLGGQLTIRHIMDSMTLSVKGKTAITIEKIDGWYSSAGKEVIRIGNKYVMFIETENPFKEGTINWDSYEVVLASASRIAKSLGYKE